MTDPLEIVVDAEQAGVRLDRFIPDAVEGLSRSRAQAMIRDGQILLNGTTATPRQATRAGDVVVVRPQNDEPDQLRPEPIQLEVLFEDDHLVAVNKAHGMVVHPGAGVHTGTLVHALLHHCAGKLSGVGEADRPGIVHRLDKDTSGCIVAAKTDAAHESLAAGFAGREMHKEYLCLVRGEPTADEGEIRNHIGRNPGNRQKMAVIGESEGRFAHTDWFVVERRGDCSLVRCRIHTGRTHQIRVHMAQTLGHPIIGDPIYGRGTLKHEAGVRLQLHSWKLEFAHPHTGERMALLAPPPPSLQVMGPAT